MIQNQENNSQMSNGLRNNTKAPDAGEAAYRHCDHIQKISDKLDLKKHKDSTSRQ